jgi:hypothetical protein
MKITPLIVAQHEAAHAVMRKICMMPATRIFLHAEGGFCEGTGAVVKAEHELLFSLAGFAWETLEGYGPKVGSINIGFAVFGPEDFRDAWRILETRPLLRLRVKIGPSGKPQAITDPVCGVLRRWYSVAMDELRPHRDLIIRVGEILHKDGEISARRVGALLRGVEMGRRCFR